MHHDEHKDFTPPCKKLLQMTAAMMILASCIQLFPIIGSQDASEPKGRLE